MTCHLRYEHGCLHLSGEIPSFLAGYEDKVEPECSLPANRYREILLKAKERDVSIQDQARNYSVLQAKFSQPIKDLAHQKQALRNWLAAKGMGVVVMPTGAGKTIFALQAICQVQRATLVVVPTLDLVQQWVEVIKKFLDIEAGVLGGGQHDIRPVTVATYDSAAIHMKSIGDQFGFLVCDECHHLPTSQYKLLAEHSIAPYRLGLSATVEREDGLENFIYELLGPKVFDVSLEELSRDVVAPFQIVTKVVDLSVEEREDYNRQREIYLSFVKKHKIHMGLRNGWQNFLNKASFAPGGQEAIKAHRQQRKIAQAASAKLDEIWNIISEHKHERVIVFTDDNDLAYAIGKALVLPVITHQTKTKERKQFLDRFRSGDYKVLVSSKVLNEGVDVPEANIGVIASGSSSRREYVQRLGRVLRAKPGKVATLYELVASKTSERQVNWRRKQGVKK